MYQPRRRCEIATWVYARGKHLIKEVKGTVSLSLLYACFETSYFLEKLDNKGTYKIGNGGRG